MIRKGQLILLDTNILVHLIRWKQTGRAINSKFQLTSRPDRPLISIITVGETLVFPKKKGWGKSKQRALQNLLNNLVIVDISSQEVLDAYAEIKIYSEKEVKPANPMSDNDVWIAATAKASGAWLLTCDRGFNHLDPVHIQHTYIDPKNH